MDTLIFQIESSVDLFNRMSAPYTLPGANLFTDRALQACGFDNIFDPVLGMNAQLVALYPALAPLYGPGAGFQYAIVPDNFGLSYPLLAANSPAELYNSLINKSPQPVKFTDITFYLILVQGSWQKDITFNRANAVAVAFGFVP